MAMTAKTGQFEVVSNAVQVRQLERSNAVTSLVYTGLATPLPGFDFPQVPVSLSFVTHFRS